RLAPYVALHVHTLRPVLPAEPAVLAHLEPFSRLLLVLRRAVVPTLAVGTRQRDDVAHLVNPCRATGYRLPASGQNLGDGARAHRPAALANREPRALLDGHRRDQLRRDRRVVA